MKILLFILSIVVIINNIDSFHHFKTEYVRLSMKEPFYSASRNKFCWFLGSLANIAVVVWASWYAVSSVIEFFAK